MPSTRPVIFLAFANDQEDQSRYLRGLAAEMRGIRQALGPARQAKAVEIVERANATLGDIIDVFQDPEFAGRIAMFHYGGHADSYQLLLETDSGSVQIAHSAGFAQFLKNQSGLHLVFLNGCSTRDQADDLRKAGIPNVIATSQVINDSAARQFAIRFYKGMGGYASIEKSFKDASAELLTTSEPGNFRGLYLDAPEVEEDVLPWFVLPDPPGAFQLQRPGMATEVNVGDFKIGKYAHVLCNRYDQNDEFASEHLSASGQPRVYLIHGHREEKHESLITRFSYEYIGPRKRYLRPVEIKNWPFKGDTQTLLKSRLAEYFEGLNRGGKPIKQLNGADLLSHGDVQGKEAIIIQHNIPGEYWNEGTSELISWYISEFWNVEIPLGEELQVVIFINVLYSEEVKEGGFFSGLFSKKFDRKKILNALQGIAKKHQHQCVLLPELKMIKRTHVDDWLIETNLAELDEFNDLTQAIFQEAGKDTLRMAKVEHSLKQAVKVVRDKYASRAM